MTSSGSYGFDELSARAVAAIHLRVPRSGCEAIDAMIRDASRRDLTGQAMAGAIAESSLRQIASLIRQTPEGERMSEEAIADAANVQLAKGCCRIADALLAELKKEDGDE